MRKKIDEKPKKRCGPLITFNLTLTHALRSSKELIWYISFVSDFQLQRIDPIVEIPSVHSNHNFSSYQNPTHEIRCIYYTTLEKVQMEASFHQKDHTISEPSVLHLFLFSMLGPRPPMMFELNRQTSPSCRCFPPCCH